MTGTARTRFIQTLDLVRCLADEIQNKSQLRSLCLVSKAFHDAFTPALYGEMDIVTYQWGHQCPKGSRPEKYVEMFERLPSNPHLRHVRRLQLDLNHGGPVNEIARSLVARMPMLEEFEWDAGSLHQETMSALIRSCPHLKSFVMIYVPYSDLDHDMTGDDDDEASDEDGETSDDDDESSDSQEPNKEVAKEAQHEEEEDKTVAGMHYLARFTGLTKLTVGQMEPLVGKDGEYRRWANDIVRILVACPDLEELTLGFSEDGIRFDRRCEEFLQFVCLGYADRAARPLRLKVLRLGLGVALRRDADSGLPVPRISDLTDIYGLEELYVDCRKTNLSYNNYAQTRPSVAAIPWDVFKPDCCPALARIGIFPFPQDLDDIPAPLLSLLQLPVDHPLQQTAVYRRPSSDDNQVALRLGGFNPGFVVSRQEDDPDTAAVTVTTQEVEDAEWKAYLSLAANARSLFLQTVFDSVRLELKHQPHLEAMLRRTPGLRVLVLSAPLPVLGPAFHQPSTTGEQMDAMLAENRENTKLAISAKWRKNLARRLAQAGRGLQIVKIGRHAWRVHRGSADTMQLLSMDRYEQRRLGCFRPPGHAFPEFAPSKIYTSLGYRHEYERSVMG
ncbi:hypothetical protein MAPG_09855 [Magnaporthiopsis poae ATCC 64411]|uniref:Uncharacterized protein n=1 Tax=Magnaporthiopsis poae (strain ATCC 64411 / 73-15) TaxID=644358 RepID=A0A0C4EB14_MAGP6|nr:hypothetical protein MAPG_09855 [Magnaporthiopsis poae ATCC 64411]